MSAAGKKIVGFRRDEDEYDRRDLGTVDQAAIAGNDRERAVPTEKWQKELAAAEATAQKQNAFIPSAHGPHTFSMQPLIVATQPTTRGLRQSGYVEFLSGELGRGATQLAAGDHTAST